jgi:hypothetical protein
LAIPAKHKTGNGSQICTGFKDLNQRGQGGFAFPDNTKIRPCEVEEFLRQNAETAATQNHRTAQFLLNGLDERLEIVSENLSFLNENVVDVAERDANEIRPEVV